MNQKVNSESDFNENSIEKRKHNERRLGVVKLLYKFYYYQLTSITLSIYKKLKFRKICLSIIKSLIEFKIYLQRWKSFIQYLLRMLRANFIS